MGQRTWVILGATSIIAKEFAHCAAQSGYHLLLVGRQEAQLHLLTQDISLRYQVTCESIVVNLPEQVDRVLDLFKQGAQEQDLLLAHSDFTENAHLNKETISHLIGVNILVSSLVIHAYLNRQQTEHNLLYLSSVAACRGRSKNSLYGASKASIEVYLQGLQQAAKKNQQISIARLGFIDTKQTYGLPGIFYAGEPGACAKACWRALYQKKRMFYYPFFWRPIAAILTKLPFFLYKKIAKI